MEPKSSVFPMLSKENHRKHQCFKYFITFHMAKHGSDFIHPKLMYIDARWMCVKREGACVNVKSALWIVWAWLFTINKTWKMVILFIIKSTKPFWDLICNSWVFCAFKKWLGFFFIFNKWGSSFGKVLRESHYVSECLVVVHFEW